MSRRHLRQDGTGIDLGVPIIGALFADGITVPSNGAGGYAPGCLFIDTDAAGGLQLWINEGSVTSAAFKVIPSGTSGTFAVLTPTTIVRTSQILQLGGVPKAGTTAGWTVGAGNNLGTIATMAASQSAGTLVIGITGLHVGDTITGFKVIASINSAGGTVTLDADLRKLVVAAGATATDSSIGTMTQVSVTAATASVSTKTGLTEVVATGVRYYLLLTGTTAGSTTIELDQVELVVTTS